MATKRTETSLEIRELVIKLKNEAKSLNQISQIIGRSRATVQGIIRKYNLTKTTENLPRTGRPPKLNGRDKREIIRTIRNNPKTTAVDIAKHLEKVKETDVNPECVRRALREEGYNSRIPRKKPLISEVNRDKRLAFAHLHENDNFDYWSKVIFTDESKFNIFGWDGKQKVWRKPGTELELKNLIPTVKHGGGSVMVWGCFSASGVGNLVFIETTMDRFVYLNILKNNLKQSVRKLGMGNDWIFQQDQDPKHTAGVVKEWLLYNTPRQLHSPSQSSDLNPIENLWDELDRSIRKRQIKSKDDLKKALLEEWQKIPRTVTEGLVYSMPNRMRAVLNSKGGPTKY